MSARCVTARTTAIVARPYHQYSASRSHDAAVRFCGGLRRSLTSALSRAKYFDERNICSPRNVTLPIAIES